MSVTTRRMSERQRQEEEHTIVDQVSRGVMMYPVFCTAKIPSEILDEFIDESYMGIIDTIGDNVPDHGASPYILPITDLDSIAHGSRKPMLVDFESPFLHWTDEQVRDWVTKESRLECSFIALRTFTIQSIIRYAGSNGKAPLQMVEVDWEETMSGVDGVYGWKAIEKENAMLQKRRKELEQEKRK
ncbi:hypothetical protein MaudCBS49596_002271 [Microsporum audouinii]